jgi:cobalt-zinc-cadmium efflux system membrane fusion protein
MKVTLILVSFAVIVSLGITGCGGNKSEDASNKENSALEERDFNSIIARPEVADRLKLGFPALIELADRIQVPSRVQVDEERTAHMGSYITGRIVNLFVILGDYVKPGQALARITSPDLTTSQLAYLRAMSRVIVTQKASDRARHLLAADAIPVAEVERRQSELEIAKAEMAASKDQLILFGMDESDIKKLNKTGKILPWIDIKTNREGYVIARNVIVGQVVQPSDLLFQIADLSYVWVVGDVPEQIAREVELGQHVEINVPALGNHSLDGVIIFVSDTINRLTRTVMTRVLVENPERKLKPDMLANMHITDPLHKSIVVPETAVVRELNLDYVFVTTGENRFQRVPVELGPELAGVRPVIKGLSTDQQIVTEGAFHLDSERKLAELE